MGNPVMENVLRGIEGTEAVRLGELFADFRATRGCGSCKGFCSLLDVRSLALAFAFGACRYWRDAFAESIDLGGAELHEGRLSAYTSRTVSSLI